MEAERERGRDRGGNRISSPEKETQTKQSTTEHDFTSVTPVFLLPCARSTDILVFQHEYRTALTSQPSSLLAPSLISRSGTPSLAALSPPRAAGPRSKSGLRDSFRRHTETFACTQGVWSSLSRWGSGQERTCRASIPALAFLGVTRLACWCCKCYLTRGCRRHNGTTRRKTQNAEHSMALPIHRRNSV